MYGNNSTYATQYGNDRFIKYGKSKNNNKKYGLQYNTTVPISAIGIRPIYNTSGFVVNIPDWQIKYNRPKARINYN